jgi:DNA polymerase-3 subunit epsilon
MTPIEPTLRHIAFDTETTGFSSPRVIELAAVEFDPSTGVSLGHFHSFLDPQGTPVASGAFAIHGLSDHFLQGQPRFAEVADAFLAFVSGARLYAHNAPFDRRMLDAELGLLARPGIAQFVREIVCTLALAQRGLAHLPKKRLDSLCDHFGVDRSARIRHGALLDCELLARVAVRMGATVVRGPTAVVRRGRPGSAPESLPAVPTGASGSGDRGGWRPGGAWLEDERKALAQAWRKGEAIETIVGRHRRSTRAIVMQLQRMGEIDEARALTLLIAGTPAPGAS